MITGCCRHRDVTNAGSISGQSIPSGLALHQGLVEHQEPGVPVEWLEQPRFGGEPVPVRARTRGGQARFHQATTVAKMTATIAAMPWTVLIQSIMPGTRPRALDHALDHPNLVGVHVLQPITRQPAETKGRLTLPHQEGDHAGAGRGGRGGWRTPHERRDLVP